MGGVGAIASFLLWVFPAVAELPTYEVIALVEALRLAAPQTQTAEPLYSPWKIKPVHIGRWSKFCIGQTLSPEAFEADLTRAREILVCILAEVFAEEYTVSQQKPEVAVRRTAAWWVSGNPNLYNQGDIAVYTKKVWSFYQELHRNPTDFIPSQVGEPQRFLYSKQ